MTVREYLISEGAIESYCAAHNFNAEFTLYDKDVEHAISFVSNAVLEEHDVYFDVYFWGVDNTKRCILTFAEIDSRMRIATVEEAKFIVDHILK